jgi:TolB-like protein
MNPTVPFPHKGEGALRDKTLDSWKEIARFLNRDVRTVMRWEKSRALPVRRMPGGKKPGVYAMQSEVDAWRNGSAQDRRRDRGAATARPTEPSIAVLPFLNLSSEKESEFFGDGLADEIISLLTRLPGLKVTARTSSFAFRGWNGDVREIGSKLGVRTLLEGSIRHAGGRMRISVQLVNAADGFHLWAEVYDRKSEDLFAVQDDVSRAVARALQIHSVPGAVPAGRRTSDMKAYREWLKGRYHLRNRRSAGEVIAGRDCFVHAIGIDPDFAAAYIGLAEYYREAAFLGLRGENSGVACAGARWGRRRCACDPCRIQRDLRV